MKRNKHSLSHYKLLTAEMGKIIPIAWYEALPGDTFQASTSLLLRFSPMLSPMMHSVRIRIHHFFVPNRLVWDDWEDFITGGPDGNDASVHPYINLSSGKPEGSLHDYMGIPPAASYPNLHVSALPFRAYNLIWNEFYRDQDLQDELAVVKTSGVDITTEQTLQNCNWEKDYFTTARPWEQKGTEVTIPVGDAALVKLSPTTGKQQIVRNVTDHSISAATDLAAKGTSGYFAATGGGSDKVLDPGETYYADLSLSTGVSVNDLRLALAIQRYQEARAQYGSRYVEYLRYLGVRSSDARLQNPEYLGGGRSIVQVSEIVKTGSVEDPSEPIGTLKGHGIAAMRTARFRRFFEEHGIIMSLLSVIPKTVYTTALHKKWSRTIKEEYYQKELAFLGDQPVLNKEVQWNHSSPDATFGYVPRYDDYRYHPSEVHGEFRSTLDYWHMAREFSGDVALNESFIQAVPTKRVFASTDTNPLYIMLNNKIVGRRPVLANAHAKTF